jgi:ATP-dependent helicase/nuclease subunit B
MDAGNYAHRVLENFSASIRELPDLPGPDDYSTVRSLFAAACRTPRERMEAAGLLSDPAGQMLHDRMDEVLESLCFWLVETWRLYNLRPVAEEVPFQFSIPVRDPAGSDWTLVLAGKIDRIDETIGSGSANPSRCVVDYKLSRKKFDFGRWFTGENSQLPIYLLAARDSGGAESVSAGFYLEIITAGDDAKRRYSGLAGREVLLRMLTPCGESITRPSHIEGTATDPANGIGKWGSAVLDSDLELILDHTRRMIEEAVGRIAAADIAIEPSRIGDNTACAWCGFKSVCQHDFTVNGIRRKPALGRIDVISQLRAGIQTEKGAGG